MWYQLVLYIFSIYHHGENIACRCSCLRLGLVGFHNHFIAMDLGDFLFSSSTCYSWKLQLLPNTACCFTTALHDALWISTQARALRYQIENRPVHCFFRWFHLMFPSRQDPQLLFWVTRHAMGWSNRLVNVRGAYYSIYVCEMISVFLSFVFQVPPWKWVHLVWRTAGVEQKNHPPWFSPHRRTNCR